MKLFVQLLVLFFAITGAASMLVGYGNVEFGSINYWNNHGVFLLIFLTLFPRLTLFCSSIPFGGFLWWLGFFFAPRILIAALATVGYWQTNPVLVIAAWFIAISGESAEKWGFRQKVHIRFGGRTFGNAGHYQQQTHKTNKVQENVVDAEFRRVDD